MGEAFKRTGASLMSRFRKARSAKSSASSAVSSGDGRPHSHAGDIARLEDLDDWPEDEASNPKVSRSSRSPSTDVRASLAQLGGEGGATPRRRRRARFSGAVSTAAVGMTQQEVMSVIERPV